MAMENEIIKYYKELRIEYELTKLKIKFLEDKKTYISTLADKIEYLKVEYELKEANIYIKKVYQHLKALNDSISKIYYSFESKEDRSIFLLHFMNNNTMETIIKKTHLKQQEIESIINNINSQINSIKV